MKIPVDLTNRELGGKILKERTLSAPKTVPFGLAPTRIIRACSAASRFRSLCSPLRDLDPASARPLLGFYRIEPSFSEAGLSRRRLSIC
jgi:hypothetical protein